MKDEWNPFLKKAPTLDELDQVACPKCGNGIFGRHFRVFRQKGAPPDSQLFTMPIFACANCGEIVSSKKEDDANQLSLGV